MIIANKESQILDTNESNSEIIKAEIHDSAVIIDYLRNKMYNHKIQTPVQEYISNAIDAMNSIGNKNPITITLSSGIKQEFKIRDFGPGLSEEGIKKVFTQYGNSLKLGTNNQIGGYGLGSKSGWAYSPVFFVSSYFNGKKFVYIARIGENQEGEFIRSAVIDTTEPNGLEISIPVIKVEDTLTFTKAAYRASIFREIKPIILENSMGLEESYKEIDDVWIERPKYKLLRKHYHLKTVLNTRDDIILSVDGVPYNFPTNDKEINELQELIHSSLNQGFLIVKARTGEVLIQPDRERVSEDEKTLAFIKERLRFIKDDLLKRRLRKLNSPDKDFHSYMNKMKDDDRIFSYYFKHGKNRKTIQRPSFNNNGIILEYKSVEKIHFQNLYNFKNKLLSIKNKFDEIQFYTLKGSTLSKRNSLYLYSPNDKKAPLSLGIEITDKGIQLSNDGIIYLDVDEEITEFQLKRKIKFFLSKRRHNKVCVVPKDFLEFFNFSIPNSTKTSTIALPKSAIKEKNAFAVNNYHSQWYGVKRTRKELDLNAIKNQKYIYMKLEKNKHPEWFDSLSDFNKSNLITFLEIKGYKLCSFGKNMEEQIKDNDNFININEYKKTFSNVLTEVAVIFNYEDNFIKELKEVNPSFVNDEMNEIFFLASNIKGDVKKIPECLIENNPENEEFIQRIKENVDSFTSFFKEQFPLVYHTELRGNKAVINEMVNYCNLKINQINKTIEFPKVNEETKKIIKQLRESK